MKLRLFAFVLLLGMTLPSFGQKNTFDLSVTISGLTTEKGKVFVALYNSESTFLKKITKAQRTAINQGAATVIFKDLIEGEYAVSTFHDKNDNKKMDKNFMGIPKEPYGFSNEAKGFMGPPKYEDAKFSLEKDKSITISIK